MPAQLIMLRQAITSEIRKCLDKKKTVQSRNGFMLHLVRGFYSSGPSASVAAAATATAGRCARLEGPVP
jgi:hypothetical protein